MFKGTSEPFVSTQTISQTVNVRVGGDYRGAGNDKSVRVGGGDRGVEVSGGVGVGSGGSGVGDDSGSRGPSLINQQRGPVYSCLRPSSTKLSLQSTSDITKQTNYPSQS